MTVTDQKVLCWLAYHTDWSSISAYYDEIDALRFALENHMQVIPVRDGAVIR